MLKMKERMQEVPQAKKKQPSVKEIEERTAKLNSVLKIYKSIQNRPARRRYERKIRKLQGGNNLLKWLRDQK